MVKSIKNSITGLRTFVGEVNIELKKCSWPTRQELLESTIVVLVATAIMGIFIGASDLVLMQLLRMVIR